MPYNSIGHFKSFELVKGLVKKALLLKNKELEKFFELNKNISAFKNHLNDITLSENGVLLKNHRIVIPKSLRNRIVDIAHDGHMGISKTKSLIREHIWFPDIDNMVQDKLKNCLACQANTDNTVIEPLIMSELPKRPWQYLSMDFYEIDGLSFFVLMDEYCRFPIVNELKITNASNVIKKLDELFSQFGYPEKIKSDNGPPFDSKQLADYFAAHNVKHQFITPYWPRANGEVERFMRCLNKLFRTIKIEKKNYKVELQSFLRNYRSTPHSTTGVSPASLLLKTSNPTLLPKPIVNNNNNDISKFVADNDRKNKEKIKKYADSNLHTKHI